MKEEAPNKKLPPKLLSVGNSAGSGIGTNMGTPNKIAGDEILSSLLRINNFDSISSIKDESLDIDLSACVTISTDPNSIMNGNSLSSADFWRVLDESAQNPQLDISACSEESIMAHEMQEDIDNLTQSGITSDGCIILESRNSFRGTFLRPDPPAPVSFSPMKKNNKTHVIENLQRKTKLSPALKSQVAYIVKDDMSEGLGNYIEDNLILENGNNSGKLISATNFNLFMLPTTTTAAAAAAAATAATATATAITAKTTNVLPALTPLEKLEDNEIKESNVTLEEPTYKCVDCNGLELHGQKEFSTHYIAKHRILYKCNMCERAFEQEASLKKHLKTHRSVEARKDAWKKCPDCGKCLKLGSMWMHRKIHSDNKKYGCDICGQKFVQKINLTHHSRVHTAEKPFECPECQKRFQERSHLQRHQKYHAQTRSYRCEKCGKMYKTERCLKVHNLVHLEQRPFACTVCDKSFISNSKLKQHSNIHTGERPFKCNYCPRDFTNFPNWLKHTRRRHKVDHKTGEHLENIPSYCSKKSTKTAKAQKGADTTATATTTATITSTSHPTVIVNAAELKNAETLNNTPIAKPEAKRKKKATAKDTNAALLAKSQANNQCGNTVSVVQKPQTVVKNLTATKSAKPKRERKQPTPKQVQKPPVVEIKKEIVEPQPVRKSKSPVRKNYTDVHSLSITSAEELIMEQALEMEECGLYDGSAAVVNTDNAMSSEAVSQFHFKVKNEFIYDDIKEEEYLSLKDSNNHVLCSSLESSPFSSPASIELSSSTQIMQPIPTEFRVPTFYVPTFALNPQGTFVSNLRSSLTNTSTPFHTTSETASTQIDQLKIQSDQTQLLSPATTQALISQLYLPMTVNMQPNQTLPSVDTLLLSSHLFNNKSVTQITAQQNLS